MDAFIGQITMAGFGFAPRGWAFCDGTTLPIQQNAALYSLLSTYYGGNGTTTFQLPNLCGRTTVGWHQGPGLSAYQLGDRFGAETVALNAQQMPIHSHSVQATTTTATKGIASNIPAAVIDQTTGAPVPAFAVPTGGQTVSLTNPMASSGASQGHENRQPFSVVNFIIATTGFYPQRP